MLNYLIFFSAGAFLANALPHVVNGISGRHFPTPFAKPPGRGQSCAIVNVLWGVCNLVAGYLLLHEAGVAHPTPTHVAVAGLGALVMAVFLAWHFGRISGENRPKTSGKQ